MELVDPNLPPPATGYTYSSYYSEKTQGAGPATGIPSNYSATGTFNWILSVEFIFDDLRYQVE